MPLPLHKGATGTSIWGLWRDAGGAYFCKVAYELFPYDPVTGKIGSETSEPCMTNSISAPGAPKVGTKNSESASAVLLRQAGGLQKELARANIVSLRSEGRSLMPEGLEEGLTAQDMADLLEYVLTAK